MILCINTALAEHHLALVEPKTKKIIRALLTSGHESETILATIDRLLKKAKIKPADLTGVAILTGPGGFTSLRVGITIANTFASQLKIPIKGITTEAWQKLSEKNLEERWLNVSMEGAGRSPLEPNYGRPPTITPPKSGSMRPQHSFESSP